MTVRKLRNVSLNSGDFWFHMRHELCSLLDESQFFLSPSTSTPSGPLWTISLSQHHFLSVSSVAVDGLHWSLVTKCCQYQTPRAVIKHWNLTTLEWEQAASPACWLLTLCLLFGDSVNLSELFLLLLQKTFACCCWKWNSLWVHHYKRHLSHYTQSFDPLLI